MIYLRIDSFTHLVQPPWGTGLDLPWTTALQLKHPFSGVALQLPRTSAVQAEPPTGAAQAGQCLSGVQNRPGGGSMGPLSVDLMKPECHSQDQGEAKIKEKPAKGPLLSLQVIWRYTG